MFTEILLFLALLCVVIYLWMKERYKYFEKLDMEYVKPYFLLGSMKDVFLKKDNFVDCAETVYKSGKSGIMGMFETIAPVFLVRNPEIARQIFIKDFNHFTDHRKMFNDGSLFDHSLFQLEGEKWKDMRSTLSPAYTGNKMRGMFELMKEIAQQASVHLKEKEIGNEINLKDFFSRFANDVIASTAFGFKINSFEDQDNEFFKMGKDVTTFDGWDMMKAIVINVCNKLARMLGLAFISKKAHNYYMNLVLNAMKYRSENQIFRPDMINMLMEVKGIGVQGTAEHKPHFNWTDEEIVAQCFILFFAGFDTVSTTLSFAGHELMENPEVQERLKEEVREIKESLNGGPLTYEAVGNMKYAEAVIFETLRKWPQLPLVDRMCTKAIDLEDPETGKVINLKPGDTIQVSSVGIHRDEKYFPDPMKFCPDRFLDENKKTSMNYFMGFGMGPRMCIGNRFAMMEIKALLFYLMQHISFEKSEKSTIPMILDPTTPQMEPKGGIWVKVAADNH